jgi:hypothetical protein
MATKAHAKMDMSEADSMAASLQPAPGSVSEYIPHWSDYTAAVAVVSPMVSERASALVKVGKLREAMGLLLDAVFRIGVQRGPAIAAAKHHSGNGKPSVSVIAMAVAEGIHRRIKRKEMAAKLRDLGCSKRDIDDHLGTWPKELMDKRGRPRNHYRKANHG